MTTTTSPTKRTDIESGDTVWVMSEAQEQFLFVINKGITHKDIGTHLSQGTVVKLFPKHVTVRFTVSDTEMKVENDRVYSKSQFDDLIYAHVEGPKILKRVQHLIELRGSGGSGRKLRAIAAMIEV